MANTSDQQEYARINAISNAAEMYNQPVMNFKSQLASLDPEYKREETLPGLSLSADQVKGKSFQDLLDQYVKDENAEPEPKYDNMDIYVAYKFADIYGVQLTPQEIAQKYSVEGGVERVEEIVNGIQGAIENKMKGDDRESQFVRKLMQDLPGLLDQARKEFKVVSGT